MFNFGMYTTRLYNNWRFDSPQWSMPPISGEGVPTGAMSFIRCFPYNRRYRSYMRFYTPTSHIPDLLVAGGSPAGSLLLMGVGV